jgi:hypothetical protein
MDYYIIIILVFLSLFFLISNEGFYNVYTDTNLLINRANNLINTGKLISDEINNLKSIIDTMTNNRKFTEDDKKFIEQLEFKYNIILT